jgi:hypothetical protein
LFEDRGGRFWIGNVGTRGEFPEARTVMLTTFEGDVEIRRALEAGARAYMQKSMPPKAGSISAKSSAKQTGSPGILRLVVGNPLIMKRMAVHVHDAASYAPVDILIDERADGVHVSYDQMASLLAPYGRRRPSRWRRVLTRGSKGYCKPQPLEVIDIAADRGLQDKT